MKLFEAIKQIIEDNSLCCYPSGLIPTKWIVTYSLGFEELIIMEMNKRLTIWSAMDLAKFEINNPIDWAVSPILY